MSTTLHFLVKSATLLVGLAAGLLLLASNARGQQTSSDSRNGQSTYTTATSAGSISITLPSDIREGDTISGIISAKPAGDTPGERQKNADTLNGVIVDFAGRRTPVSDTTISGSALSHGMTVMQWGESIKLTTKHYVPVAPVLGKKAQDTQLQKIRMMPRYGHCGGPVEIKGDFDGYFGTTAVAFSGRMARILAESPRSLIVECPKDQPGALELSVTERGHTVRGPFQNLTLELSASKTAGIKGKTETVLFRVKNLPMEFEDIVEFSLVSSPSIQMQGGNVQSIKIAPSMAPDGVFETRRQITGITAGGFDVTAMLMTQDPPKEDPPFPGAFDMNGINSLRQVLGIVAGMNADEQERRLRATLKTLRQRLSDATDEDIKDWLKEKIKIVEKTMETLGITE